MLMRQTLTQMSSHSFVSDSAHVKYIYHVWTGRKSICAPDKHCIYPYRHPSPAFLRWFLGRPQEDLEVPFILRKPVQGRRATLLAESLNLRERLYEKKSWTLCPSKQRSCMLWLSKPALAHALLSRLDRVAQAGRGKVLIWRKKLVEPTRRVTFWIVPSLDKLIDFLGHLIPAGDRGRVKFPGVLPIKAYTERLCPKGVPFWGLGYNGRDFTS